MNILLKFDLETIPKTMIIKNFASRLIISNDKSIRCNYIIEMLQRMINQTEKVKETKKTNTKKRKQQQQQRKSLPNNNSY